MKNLIVIRHAKSSWEHLIDDFDREVTLKGIQNTEKIAKEALSFVDLNAVIWSSPAKRAFQTAQIVLQNWNLKGDKIELKKDLYTFDAFKLEQIVKSCPNEFQNLILFGHNNAITDFVNKFGDRFIENVPTSGVVSIIFNTDHWSTINNGKINKILFPRNI